MSNIMVRAGYAVGVSSIIALCGWNLFVSSNNDDEYELDPKKDIELLETNCVKTNKDTIFLLRRLRMFRKHKDDYDYITIVDEMDKLLTAIQRINDGVILEPNFEHTKFAVDCQCKIMNSLNNMQNQLPRDPQAHYKFYDTKQRIQDYVGNRTSHIAHIVYVHSR